MRGVAHLGVLAEFERAGIEIRGIAGTSSGALMGALFLLIGAEPAIGKVRAFTTTGLAEGARDLEGTAGNGREPSPWRRLRHVMTLLMATIGGPPVSRQGLIERVSFFLPDMDLADLPRPFVVVATDTATGEEVRLARGSLLLAVAGSSAMPGMVAPIVWAGRTIQDGGAVAEIPVRAARALGDPVVAIEVSEALPPAGRSAERVPAALFRAAAMGWGELRRRTLKEADAVISPAVHHLNWAAYESVDAAVTAGREAARDFLARL
jgi:NTE family protein